MSEMIERCVAALEDAARRGAKIGDFDFTYAASVVGIVIGAMREPTDEITTAGCSVSLGYGDTDLFAVSEWLPDAWRAMIDGALGDQA